MRKIVIDASPIGKQTKDRGGVYRYVYCLLEQLQEAGLADGVELFFNAFRSEHRMVMEEVVKGLPGSPSYSYHRAKIPPRIFEKLALPIEWQCGRFDLFHGTVDSLPKSWGGKRVVTVHDVRYLEEGLSDMDAERYEAFIVKHPQHAEDYADRGRLLASLREGLLRTLQRADHVITVSHFSKERLCAVTGFDAERVSVVYHGLNPQFRRYASLEIEGSRQKYGLQKPYLLYVSKFDPLKNVERLLEAFAEVAQALPEHELVLCGPTNWHFAYIEELVVSLSLQNRVRFPGFVEDGDLPKLYAGADCFVLPSLYEGFGFPVAEALACATPVLTSSLASIPEVVGEAAVQVDAYDVEAIAAGLQGLLEEGVAARQLRREAGLQQIKQFSWRRCAQQTVEVYEQVLG